ncbi:MAG: GNAT family N-acetyltransferase [Zoogloeaceae bacterium]|jgi:GNAT superfamily N-acetyltransferase|nr:GNAT family N-acetyltransferase [Zoogloeaceae bacterium]
MMSIELLSFTDDQGLIVAENWLPRVEAVHRQLHSAFPAGHDAYRTMLLNIFESGGRMCLAVEGAEVLGVVIWRIVYNSLEKKRLHVDDIVTVEGKRSQGVGKLLMEWAEQRARALGCATIALDSGVQRDGAHRFYFREKFRIASYYFVKTIAAPKNQPFKFQQPQITPPA